MTQPRQRIAPKPEEVKRAHVLLRAVPAIGLDWSSHQGQAFLAYVFGLTEQGVPVRWLAEQLSLDANRLYSTLNRYRRSVA